MIPSFLQGQTNQNSGDFNREGGTSVLGNTVTLHILYRKKLREVLTKAHFESAKLIRLQYTT